MVPKNIKIKEILALYLNVLIILKTAENIQHLEYYYNKTTIIRRKTVLFPLTFNIPDC